MLTITDNTRELVNRLRKAWNKDSSDLPFEQSLFLKLFNNWSAETLQIKYEFFEWSNNYDVFDESVENYKSFCSFISGGIRQQRMVK